MMRNNLTLTPRFAWVVMCFVCANAHAASFDCKKAKTETEKTICGSAELSKRDEELAKVYREALSKTTKAGAKQKLQKDQREWPAMRDARCYTDEACVAAEYEDRTEVIKHSNDEINGGRATMKREKEILTIEADKLTTIIGILREKKFTPEWTAAEPFCKRFMNDLLANRQISAIEPDVRTNLEDDPRLEKWHRCDGAQETGAKERSREYLGLYVLGSPPFRYYRVELDGNLKNGKEDLLYHEKSGEPPVTGKFGYSRVNFDRCVIEDFISLSLTNSYPMPPLDGITVNLLAKYQGEPLVLELVSRTPTSDDSRPATEKRSVTIGPTSKEVAPVNYTFSVSRFYGKRPYVCSWTEFPQK